MATTYQFTVRRRLFRADSETRKAGLPVPARDVDCSASGRDELRARLATIWADSTRYRDGGDAYPDGPHAVDWTGPDGLGWTIDCTGLSSEDVAGRIWDAIDTGA
jgi:hypothetical protein